MNKIILIGGSPTAGKSSVAKKLSKSLKVNWISTDALRGQMSDLVSKKDYPALFKFKDTESKKALKYLQNASPKDFVSDQIKESLDVWVSVKAMINNTDWDSYIIEGIAIMPKQVHELQKTNKKIKAVFVIDENSERIRKCIFTRGLWNDAKKYPDKHKEKEIQWVLLFNEFLKKECKKYNLPLISVKNRKDLEKEIKKIL